MVNARLVYIGNTKDAYTEIKKIGCDSAALNWLVPKALHMAVKLENVSSYAANIIKQEMLGKGGDAVVNRGVADFSVSKSDVLIMGTYAQFDKLLYKLNMQSPQLRSIAKEIEFVLSGIKTEKLKNFECRRYNLPMGKKTYIMGILNITPDSFSDGGNYVELETAINKAKAMVQEGADIIDIGGESTRPGYEQVDADVEIKRVVPVVERLVKELSVPISVDTSKAMVAKKVLELGADIINDQWGLQKESDMAKFIADYNAGVIVMHNQNDKEYNHFMGDIIRFLRKSIEIARNAGIKNESICIDPGVGFGKDTQNNIEVIRRLKELKTLNLPILLGTSRKSVIGNTLNLPIEERLEGTIATVSVGIVNGADIVRVHDVKEVSRAAKMTDAIVREQKT